jgi:hypothetical protein
MDNKRILNNDATDLIYTELFIDIDTKIRKQLDQTIRLQARNEVYMPISILMYDFILKQVAVQARLRTI